MPRDILPPIQRTGTLQNRSITPPLIRNNPLNKLIPKTPATPQGPSPVRLTWATVTAAFPDPVQIQIDTEDQPLAAPPEMGCQVELGDRVVVAITNGQAIALTVAQPDQSQQTPTIQTGAVIITPTAANTPTVATVTFDTAFADVPYVVCTAWTTAPGTVVTGCSVGGATTTTADLYLTRTDTTATRVNWIATSI